MLNLLWQLDSEGMDTASDRVVIDVWQADLKLTAQFGIAHTFGRRADDLDGFPEDAGMEVFDHGLSKAGQD
jgi:hypothetical protein